jgi:hypothetical protein
MDQEQAEEATQTSWSGRGPTMMEQFRQQDQERAMLPMNPDWMSEAVRHMMDVEGLKPVQWNQFFDLVRLSDHRGFSIVEQRRFEQCEVTPATDDDAVVGVSLVVWLGHYVKALRTSRKLDFPIATTGMALEAAIKNLPDGYHITLHQC